jgi:hypothetical protein
VIVAVAISGAILLAMIGLSWHGAVTLPPEARVPVHWSGSYGNFQSKRTGLITYPAVAAGIIVLLAGIGQIRSKGHSAGQVLAIILPIAMVTLIVTQIGAIRAARRNSGSGPIR